MKSKKTMTERALLANRTNAQKSTGPRNTAAVAQNARTHGLLSKNLRFENEEDRNAFQELHKEMAGEQKPAGPIERILLEEAAVSIWKLRMTNGWDVAELMNRRRAARAVIKKLEENGGDDQLQLFSAFDDEKAALRHGWHCQELVIRSGTKNVENDTSFSNANTKGGHLQVEAKLSSSLDAVLRYQAAIKRDLYRAIAVLRDMRDNKQGGSR
jgi:hypothetical protein